MPWYAAIAFGICELVRQTKSTDWSKPLSDTPKAYPYSSFGDYPVLHRSRVRRANPVSVNSIFEATASKYAVSADEYVGFRSGAAGRDMAAYLCRRYTSATLRKLSERFGLNHPDSALDLIRRGAKRIEQSREAVRQQKDIEKKLELNPESRA